MERLTKQREDASYFVEEAALRQEPLGYSGEAVDRLAILKMYMSICWKIRRKS